jgi:A/G-specific adenine glycosylase
MPDDPDIWRSLPGVGRYILGAVLSQAFDRRMPIVETNSQRVLCRLFGQTADPRRGPARNWLWQVAERVLPARRAGDFNQALMELGALVCTPAAPSCAVCPLGRDCTARRLGIQETIPPPAAPPVIVEVREVAVIVRRGSRVLLVQRPALGRWANMWEFPHGVRAANEVHEEAAGRVLEELTGLRAELGGEWLTVRHSVTRHRIEMVCFEARYRAGRFRSAFYQQAMWVAPEQLHAYPVSMPQRRLARSLDGAVRQRQLF